MAERLRIGKFELVEQIGSGASGAVWRARDTELGRVVAVKVPRSGRFASDKEAQRFDREARSAAQLRHPGIVTLHEVGRFEKLPFIVTDFIQGLTLAEYLEAHKPGYRESAELVALVADALDYAHSMGVVHRDVKPSNIMLERGGSGSRSGTGLTGSTGLPLLMDFGLALRADVDATLTQEGEVLGTPAYMSPEQAAGQSHKVDARSDAYSLGVVLYRLLTGRLPFQGTLRVILDQVLNEEPTPPRKLDRTIPRDLETICLKSMGKEPSRRYQSARELSEDLRCYLAGRPIQARPLGRLERLWRRCRRNPWIAGLLGSLLIVLLSGVAGITWQWRVAEQQRWMSRQREAELSQVRHLVRSLKEQIGRQDAELLEAQSRYERLLTEMARRARLNQRKPGMISAEGVQELELRTREARSVLLRKEAELNEAKTSLEEALRRLQLLELPLR